MNSFRLNASRPVILASVSFSRERCLEDAPQGERMR